MPEVSTNSQNYGRYTDVLSEGLPHHLLSIPFPDIFYIYMFKIYIMFVKFAVFSMSRTFCKIKNGGNEVSLSSNQVSFTQIIVFRSTFKAAITADV